MGFWFQSLSDRGNHCFVSCKQYLLTCSLLFVSITKIDRCPVSDKKKSFILWSTEPHLSWTWAKNLIYIINISTWAAKLFYLVCLHLELNIYFSFIFHFTTIGSLDFCYDWVFLNWVFRLILIACQRIRGYFMLWKNHIHCAFLHSCLVWFNGISTFVGYLMPKPFSQKNSSGTI